MQYPSWTAQFVHLNLPQRRALRGRLRLVISRRMSSHENALQAPTASPSMPYLLGEVMKMIVSIFALATALTASGAYAQTTCQSIGSQRICTDAYGNSSTTQQIGNQAFTNYSNGQSATTQHIGNQSITNYSDGTSATSQRIGNQRITNYDDGSSATTQNIGNQTITNYSNGTTRSCQYIGNQYICN